MCCCLIREKKRVREREDIMLDGESQGKCEKDNIKKKRNLTYFK